jgi:parallel beta-helix repeat protein
MDRDCYGNTVSANVIAHNAGGGVDLRDAWGCAVSANTFTIVAVRALVVGPHSGRITITGNNFSDSYIGAETRREGQPNLATGVLLNGTCDVVVSGNVFSGLTGEAITADSACQRLLLVNNLVRAAAPPDDADQDNAKERNP